MGCRRPSVRTWGNSSYGVPDDLLALEETVVTNNIVGYNSSQTSVDISNNYNHTFIFRISEDYGQTWSSDNSYGKAIHGIDDVGNKYNYNCYNNK